jgi:hypothetical protein
LGEHCDTIPSSSGVVFTNLLSPCRGRQEEVNAPSPRAGEGQYCSAQILSSGAALVPPPRRGRAGWGCTSAEPSGPASPPIPIFPRGEGERCLLGKSSAEHYWGKVGMGGGRIGQAHNVLHATYLPLSASQRGGRRTQATHMKDFPPVNLWREFCPKSQN